MNLNREEKWLVFTLVATPCAIGLFFGSRINKPYHEVVFIDLAVLAVLWLVAACRTVYLVYQKRHAVEGQTAPFSKAALNKPATPVGASSPVKAPKTQGAKP